MKETVHTEKQQIVRASKIMAVFTLFSRLLGLVRNQILSHFFGATWVADAFIAAFTIPNALRRLFGEGALTPAIVSIFTRVLKGPQEAGQRRAFVSASFWWLSSVLVLVVLAGILLAPVLVRLYVPEFVNVPGKMELTISLTRWLFPFILFLGWAALAMGLLNSIGLFGVSAFSPALLNIAVIIVVPTLLFTFQPDPTTGIFIFASAVLMGGALQAFIHLWPLSKNALIPSLVPSLTSPHLTDLKKLMLPSVLAMGTYQLNIIVNRVFASQIDGAVSHLFYADLILELPISLIAVSLGTAVVPTFSRYATTGDHKGLGDTFRFALEGALFFAIPAMLGVLVLATPLCSSLYFSGKFTLHDLEVSSLCLMAYSLGLPFFAALRILTPLFFAQKDTVTPTIVSFVALTVNFVAAWKLSSFWGASGIALATVISSIVNFFVLGMIVFFKHRDFEWSLMTKSVLKIVFSSALMGGALVLILQSLPTDFWTSSGITMKKLSALLGLVALGITAFGVAALFLKLPQAQAVYSRLRSKTGL